MLVSKELSESTLKAAFSSCNWPDLKTHFDTIGFDGVALDALLGHLRRFSGFILCYPNPKRESSRNEFFKKLMDYVRTHAGVEAVTRTEEEVALLLQIERGYRRILLSLSGAELSKLSPDARVSACTNWALQIYEKLMERHGAANKRPGGFAFQNDPSVRDDDGKPISMDAAITAIVKALSTTLIMEARKNNWHHSSGTVLLPEFPAVDQDAVFNAHAFAELAMCWSRWRQTEERRRFFGGELREFSAPALPSWVPAEATHATEYTPNDREEFFDFAANERVMDRLGQQYFELLVETDLVSKVSGIANTVALLPDGLVSLSEAHAASGLGDILKYEITDDTERPGGLRIVEWLRGYAVLKQIAQNERESRGGVAGLLPQMVRGELLTILVRCGLAEISAAHFIDSVTLKIQSEDLFDSPLISFGHERLLIFGPALLTANLCNIVLSILGTLNEPLQRKGKAFEQSVLALLRKYSLNARGFKVTRDGEQYEFDAVLAWGGHVFVFECKNRGLSRNRPVDAHFFQLGIRSAVHQAKRLVGALHRYPDILANEMQVDVSDKVVVPVVLNSLPYSRIGEIEGVYCIDSSVLERFFSSRYFFIKIPYRVREKMTVLHRVALTSLWAGKQPCSEDLLKQLREPAQLKISKGHIQTATTIFPIGDTHLVSTSQYVRSQWTLESMCRVFGLDAQKIKNEIDRVAGKVKKIKKGARKNSKKKHRKKIGRNY